MSVIRAALPHRYCATRQRLIAGSFAQGEETLTVSVQSA